MKLAKHAGRITIFTGLLHNVLGIAMGLPILKQMHADNWIGSTMVNNTMAFDREAITWFLLSGCLMMLLGLQLADQQAKKQRISTATISGIALTGLMICIIVPASGAYLFLLIAFLLHSYNKALTS